MSGTSLESRLATAEAERDRLRSVVETALTHLERMRGWHRYRDDENVAELEATLLAALRGKA